MHQMVQSFQYYDIVWFISQFSFELLLENIDTIKVVKYPPHLLFPDIPVNYLKIRNVCSYQLQHKGHTPKECSVRIRTITEHQWSDSTTQAHDYRLQMGNFVVAPMAPFLILSIIRRLRLSCTLQ